MGESPPAIRPPPLLRIEGRWVGVGVLHLSTWKAVAYIDKSYLISGAMNQSPSNPQPSGAWKLSFGSGS